LETMLMTNTNRLAGWEQQALCDQALAAHDRTSLLLGARAAVVQNQAHPLQVAHEKLQTWLVLHVDDAAAWQQLATVAQQQGQAVEAARASAEAQRAQLDLQGALDRMRAAQTLAKRTPELGHAELSIIDARTHTLERLVREQWCEERERRDPTCQTQH
jgi:predicted Zn-dependent protease